MSAESHGVPEPQLAGLTELPEEVRTRIVALTAEVLPAVPRVPPALRKIAEFTPTRRARVGATPISSALESDPEFRERVGVQLAGRPADGSAGPDEAAALAWLVRPEGAEEALDDALAQLTQHQDRPVEDSAAVERWREKAQAAEQALRDARTKHREELGALKSDNATLRRKLGETRTALKEAVADAEAARESADQERTRAETAASTQDRELRQLRAQVERHEAEAQTERRLARADRDEVTLRARVLLETVIDAATGLRRELSLPQVTGSPGDRIEAELAADDARTTGRTTGAGSSGSLSPALLEQLLAMPRARLVVDGYNVSKTAWPSSSLEAQRIRLLNSLAPLVARTGAETTVVFDAAASSVRPVVAAPRGVKVRFSPEGVIADDVIRDLVGAEPEGRVLVVVSSDQELARDVTRDGARAVPADALVALLSRSG